MQVPWTLFLWFTWRPWEIWQQQYVPDLRIPCFLKPPKETNRQTSSNRTHRNNCSWLQKRRSQSIREEKNQRNRNNSASILSQSHFWRRRGSVEVPSPCKGCGYWDCQHWVFAKDYYFANTSCTSHLVLTTEKGPEIFGIKFAQERFLTRKEYESRRITGESRLLLALTPPVLGMDCWWRLWFLTSGMILNDSEDVFP